MWGIRVIVPPALREKVLQELHSGHSGMSRMKSLARCHVWWPCLDQEVEEVCKSCRPCQKVKSLPPTAPLHPWIWPDRPWQRVHVDFVGPFKGSILLLLVDSHSKWPEIYSMSSTTVFKTIKVLRHIFSSYGIPEQLASDNGSHGIKHIRTSPYHPSSNGPVERLVQSFKRAICASENDKKSLQCRLSTFLLNYRITSHATTNVAPCELFLNRSVRTRLDLLKPDIKCNVGWKQAQQKSDHDGSKQ